MLSKSSLNTMIPPPGGWPSPRRQCRTAMTIAKQDGAYTGHIGRHWFTVQNSAFEQPCTAHGPYSRMIATHFLNLACAEPDHAAARMLLDKATRWRKDAAFCGFRLP